MTAEIFKDKASPALEQARRLQAAADIFNTHLFDGALPPTMLRLGIRRGARGTYFPRKFVDENGNHLDCIQLNSTDATERPLIELMSTLVHEQCHQYICRVLNGGAATGGHGAEWRKKMTELGLPPIRIGSTWRQATHSISPNGAYANCFRANLQLLEKLPWQELAKDATKGRATRLDKVCFRCPSCSSKAWARSSAELLCGTCTTASPLSLIWMIPEVEAVGGGGKGSTSRSSASRTDYPEPSTTPGLPVWTEEAGRRLRLDCGIDHPPQNTLEALIVMLHGINKRDPELLNAWLESVDKAERKDSDRHRSRIYKGRARILHPDAGGHEESFKVLQIAYRMLNWDKITADEIRTATDREASDVG
ncbi:MAG: SprT-like domain-containing protein [Synechococcus sp. BS301-5m-G54]|nr:SprT-like domain-containing protein [Synechococcus sp. BS301-5m-G54]